MSPILTLAMLVWAVSPAVAAPAAGDSAEPRAWLGIFLDDSVDGGVEIVDVVPDGPASNGGLSAGDVVIRVDATDVADIAALRRALVALQPGDATTFTVLRGGARRSVRLVARALPAAPVLGLVPPAPPPPRAEVDGTALGLAVEEVPAPLRSHMGAPSGAGILVTRVDADGPCGQALRVGDLLVRANDITLSVPQDLARALAAVNADTLRLEGVRAKAGFAVVIPEVARASRARTLEVTIRELEAELAALRRELQSLRNPPQ